MSERVLSLIFQYLQENGFNNTLKELEIETGLEYAEMRHPTKGSELCCIIDEYEELQNTLKPIDNEEEQCKSLDQDLVTTLNTSTRKIQCTSSSTDQFYKAVKGDISTANKEYFSFSPHDKAVLTVRFSPFSNVKNRFIFASTSADSTIKVWEMNYTQINDPNARPILICNPPKEILNNRTPYLCLEFHPTIPGLIIAGSMDGGVSIISEVDRNLDGVVLFNKIIHSKYVVRVKWGNNCFATASYDKSVCLYTMKEIEDESGKKFEFVEKKKWGFSGNVESLEFSVDKTMLIVAVRDDNYLNYIDLTTDEVKRVNMNSLGDDHVSFTAMHLSVSPEGNHVLVQTDRDRIIVMRINSSVQVRNLYGANNNSFSQPRAIWHPSGKYIFGTSQTNQIIKWDVVTQNIDDKLSGHLAYPRDIDYHNSLELLISGSFDHSIKIWGVGNITNHNA